MPRDEVFTFKPRIVHSCFNAEFEIISLACKLQFFITKTNDLLLLKWYSKISTQRFYVIEVVLLITISKRDLNISSKTVISNIYSYIIICLSEYLEFNRRM